MARRGLLHVREDEVLQAELADRPGRVEDRRVGADHARALPVGVARGDDLLVGGQPGRSRRGPGEPVVRGQQLVDVAGDLHPGVDQHDQVVADPLEVGDQVGGEHHAELVLGDGLHQALQELAAGQRVEAGDRLVEDQQLGSLGQRRG